MELSMRKIHANISQEQSKARDKYRDRMDMLRRRVSLLVGEDRLLMTMYIENGNSFRQMAHLAGINEACIARRIRRIAKRLIDGEYIACLRSRDKSNKAEMAIAKDYFLTGLSIKKIAGKRGVTYYHVREIIKRVRRLVRDGGQGSAGGTGG